MGEGGEGGLELADKVMEACGKESKFAYQYEVGMSPKEKIERIAKNIYGASGVTYTDQAEKDSRRYTSLGRTSFWCAWRRRSTRSRTTPRCWVGLRDSR